MGSAHQLFSAHAACPVKSLPSEMAPLCNAELLHRGEAYFIGVDVFNGASLVIPPQGGENGW